MPFLMRWTSRLKVGTLVAVVALQVLSGAAHALTSDDFNSVDLDTSRWLVIDPRGDGSVEMSGTQLLLTVPAGTDHDVWKSGNHALRVMQQTSDVDFGIEVKFESLVDSKYQIQGILVEQDADNFVRADFYSDGTNVRAFLATFSLGTPKVRTNVNLGTLSVPFYMRLERQGDFWTQSYSQDGESWSVLTTFSHALTVNASGVFSGNAGGNAPEHTAIIDYMFNTASPITVEDGEQLYQLTINTLGNGSVQRTPDKTTYLSGEVVQLTASPDAGWSFDGWEGAIMSTDNPLTLVISDHTTVDAQFIEAPAEQYTISTNVIGSGSIELSPPGGSYSQGTVLTIAAIPEPGYGFSEWHGLLTGSENPTTLFVSQDGEVTATFAYDSTAPIISNVQASPTQDSATITFETDDISTAVIDYGLTTNLEMGQFSSGQQANLHIVTLNNLDSAQTYFLQISATNSGGIATLSDIIEFQTFSANDSSPEITVWSGNYQNFGSNGLPLHTINVLGNVSDAQDLDSLVYTLNNSAPASLDIGPNRRLDASGDFNVEIETAQLNSSVNFDNELVVTATDSMGNEVSSTIWIRFYGDAYLGLPSMTYFSSSKVSDFVQVTDGRWEIVEGELHNIDVGYDRAVVIGERDWTDYEVTVDVTIAGYDPEGFVGINNKPAIGVMAKWPGHSHNWVSNQLAQGYTPQGGGGFYEIKPVGNKGVLSVTDFKNFKVSDTSRTLSFGEKYTWKVRVETLSNQSVQYSLRVWSAGTPEPIDWDLVAIDSNDVASGSVILVAHFVDAYFGPVTLMPLQ